MPALHLPLLYVVDPRFPGGTSTAFAHEVAAHAEAGEQAVMVPVFAHVLTRQHAFHPALRDHLRSGALSILPTRCTVRADVVVIHHPALFETLPHASLGITANRVILVLHHPPRNAFGDAEYNLPMIVQNIRECLAAPVILAPVGPHVRDQLNGMDICDASILNFDWHNLIGPAATRQSTLRPASAPMVLGRHSRPDLRKFPDTRDEALLAYPAWPDLTVKMLGAPPQDGPKSLTSRYGPLPANWQLLPFGAVPVAEFLASLDLWAYTHSAEWVEAFGYAPLEAMAAGLPVLLPHSFAPLFGKGALYGDPADFPALIDRMRDPALRAAQGKIAAEVAATRFGLGRHRDRLMSLDVEPQEKPASPASPAPRQRVLLVTSNGVGLGHLSRMLAVARHLSTSATIEFFTLSQAYALALRQGFPTRFLPHHRVTGAPVDRWNAALAVEFGDHLDFFSPDIVVFDGNVPYEGLVAALRQRPFIKKIWMRRGLWAEGRVDGLKRSGEFDVILEPQEFSQRFDTGPTSTRADAVKIGPILNLPTGQWLDRAAARVRLTARHHDKTIVGLMLGAGSNYDLDSIRSSILAYFRTRPDVEVVEFIQPLRQTALDDPHCKIDLYPAAQLFNGLDLLVSGAGYNAFHEAILGRIPTVFVPNEAEEMDLQLLRARHAEATGCGFCLRRQDKLRLPAILSHALDAQVRQSIRDRLSRLVFCDGAKDAAEHVALIASARRMRPLANTREKST